jgi:hypothetical protein
MVVERFEGLTDRLSRSDYSPHKRINYNRRHGIELDLH